MYNNNDVFNEIKDFFNQYFDYSPADRIDFPYVNLFEKDDCVKIEAILPGVNVDDISVELNEKNIILSGERKQDNSNSKFIRRERRFGTFKKSIRLPYPVDKDKISANLKDGILIIDLVKSDEAKPKKIVIN